VAHSNTRSWKRSGGGFGHGCRAAHEARRGERPGCWDGVGGGRDADTARSEQRLYGTACVGVGAWQPHRGGVLMSGPGAEREADRWYPAAAIF
jgi:hypothetical protein